MNGHLNCCAGGDFVELELQSSIRTSIYVAIACETKRSGMHVSNMLLGCRVFVVALFDAFRTATTNLPCDTSLWSVQLTICSNLVRNDLKIDSIRF